MTATASPFLIQNVTVTGSFESNLNIFEDVQSAKARLMDIRKAAKRRLDPDTLSSRPSQQSFVPGAAVTSQSRVIREILFAETDLEELKGIRVALERRKEELRETMLELRNQVTASKARVASVSDSVIDASMSSPTKGSPVGEGEDDLSTVVCPFELMGECTDPVCRYMHLNR